MLIKVIIAYFRAERLEFDVNRPNRNHHALSHSKIIDAVRHPVHHNCTLDNMAENRYLHRMICGNADTKPLSNHPKLVSNMFYVTVNAN